MKYPQLKNPPITEAIFDIQFIADIDVDLLEKFYELIKESYPNKNDLVTFQMVGELANNSTTKNNSFKNGIRCSNQNNEFIVLLQQKGFTISKQKPYSSFTHLKNETQKIFTQFLDFLKKNNKNLVVQRTGLRYINNFMVFVGEDGYFSDFFNLNIQIPEKLPKILGGYAFQMILLNEEQESQGLISMSVNVNAQKMDFCDVVFDIDVSKYGENIQQEEIFEISDKLHDFKNDIFFQSITQKTQDFFQS